MPAWGLIRRVVYGLLLAYALLAMPLPGVLLDHELGLLTHDPAHTALDEHAWLDHAAGAGMTSTDAGITAGYPVDRHLPLLRDVFPASFLLYWTPARGPPFFLND